MCKSCGAHLDKNDKFCGNCGTKIEKLVQVRDECLYDNSHETHLSGNVTLSEEINEEVMEKFGLKFGVIEGKPKQESFVRFRDKFDRTRLLLVLGLFQSNKFSDREIEIVRDYVASGGRFWIMYYLGGNDANRLIAPYGIEFTDEVVVDELHHEGRHKDHVIISRLIDHPINLGVESFCFGDYGGISMKTSNPDTIVLAYSSKSADPQNAPVACLTPYGKGEVLAIGGTSWIQNKYMKQYDNAKWYRNILTYLIRIE
jgi:hypothetical protein